MHGSLVSHAHMYDVIVKTITMHNIHIMYVLLEYYRYSNDTFVVFCCVICSIMTIT